MNYIRPALVVAAIVNAVIALYLWANDIRMPGWFAAILAAVSLALVCSRLLIQRQSSALPSSSNTAGPEATTPAHR